MKSRLFTLLTVLTLVVSTSNVARGQDPEITKPSRVETKKKISRVAERISDRALESTLTHEELLDVQRQLESIARRLEGLGEPARDTREDRAALVDFMKDEIHKDGYSVPQALEKARAMIKPGANLDLFMFVYPNFRKEGYSCTQSIDLAMPLATDKRVVLKSEIYKFIAELSQKDGYSWKQSSAEAQEKVQTLPTNSLKALKEYVEIYKKDGYSSRQCIEKAIKLIDEDEKNR